MCTPLSLDHAHNILGVSASSTAADVLAAYEAKKAELEKALDTLLIAQKPTTNPATVTTAATAAADISTSNGNQGATFDPPSTTMPKQPLGLVPGYQWKEVVRVGVPVGQAADSSRRNRGHWDWNNATYYAPGQWMNPKP